MAHRVFARIVALAALLGLECGRAPDSHRLNVFVSIPPQAYFARRIAGSRADVHTLVAPGRSPHGFMPTPSQVARLSEARLYFRAGMEFEDGLLPKIMAVAPVLVVVDTRQGIALRSMSTEADAGHGEAKHGQREHRVGHGHHGDDPHTWLSPVLARRQAATMAEAFASADPSGASVYTANFVALAADLDSLHARLTRALAPVAGRDLLVYHPSFGYFADAYGLRQVAVEIEGKEPSARALARLVDLARAGSTRVVFVQPQFSSASARTVAAQMGGAVVPIDPLAENYIDNMRSMAAAVTAGIGEEQ